MFPRAAVAEMTEHSSLLTDVIFANRWQEFLSLTQTSIVAPINPLPVF